MTQTQNQERKKLGLTVNNRGLEPFQNIEGNLTWHLIDVKLSKHYAPEADKYDQ